MTTVYNDTLSSKILTSVIRWNSIFLSDIQRCISEHPNKESITRITNSLIKKGFLQSIANPVVNSKIIVPTDKLLKDMGASQGDSKKSHFVHNAILNNQCLDIYGFENVDEIFLEKDINGGERSPGELSPDAEAVIYIDNKPERVAIEFELTQKCKKRLQEKFIKFSRAEVYSKAVFLFQNERMATTYANFLIECISKNPQGQKDFNINKFVFAVKKQKPNSETFSGSFKVIYPEEDISLDKYFGTLK
jgi:hypothetical protein